MDEGHRDIADNPHGAGTNGLHKIPQERLRWCNSASKKDKDWTQPEGGGEHECTPLDSSERHLCDGVGRLSNLSVEEGGRCHSCC